MSSFFTKEEIKDVKDGSKNEQRNVFFDKAKLWRVIEQIISVLYIKRLADGKMFLHDKDGTEYSVVTKRVYK
jgi:hypothetical protein